MRSVVPRVIRHYVKRFYFIKVVVLVVVLAIGAFQTLPIYFASIPSDQTYTSELAALINEGQPSAANAWPEFASLINQFDVEVKQIRRQDWKHYQEFVGDFDFSNLLEPEVSAQRCERELAAMKSLEQQGFFERLRPLVVGSRLNKWEIEPLPVVDSAPELAPARRLGRALCARMRFHAEEDSGERIPADFTTLMGLADAFLRQDLVLFQLIGMSIEAEAMSELGHLLQEQSSNDQILEELDAALRGRIEVRSILPAVHGEHFNARATIQATFTQNSRGDGYFLPDAMAELGGEASERTLLTAIASRYYLPRRLEVLNLVDQWYAACTAAAASGDPAQFPRQKESASSATQTLTDLLNVEFEQAAISARYRAAHARALRLMVRARQLRNSGESPSSIDQLVEHDASSAAVPGSDQPIRYRVDRDQAGREEVFIWAVGENGVDDACQLDDDVFVAPRNFVQD